MIEFFIRKEDVFRRGLNVWIRKNLGNHGIHPYAVPEPLIFKALTEQECYGQIHNPLLQIEATEAQKLMDQLWDCGLRPTEGTGSAGAMSATQKHLEDMRTLVFKTKE